MVEAKRSNFWHPTGEWYHYFRGAGALSSCPAEILPTHTSTTRGQCFHRFRGGIQHLEDEANNRRRFAHLEYSSSSQQKEHLPK